MESRLNGSSSFHNEQTILGKSLIDEVVDLELIIIINDHTKIFKDVKINKNSKVGYLYDLVEDILS